MVLRLPPKAHSALWRYAISTTWTLRTKVTIPLKAEQAQLKSLYARHECLVNQSQDQLRLFNQRASLDDWRNRRGCQTIHHTCRSLYTYLASCDFAEQKTEVLQRTGQYWVYKLLLYLYYPLQQRIPLQWVRPGTRGLQITILFYNANELIEQHPYSAGFTWLFKAYVPWHAVAVVLAELITQPGIADVDRAWEIVESCFRDWTSRVANVKETILWRLIGNLRKRARAAQQRRQLAPVMTRSALICQEYQALLSMPYCRGFGINIVK